MQKRDHHLLSAAAGGGGWSEGKQTGTNIPRGTQGKRGLGCAAECRKEEPLLLLPRKRNAPPGWREREESYSSNRKLEFKNHQ